MTETDRQTDIHTTGRMDKQTYERRPSDYWTGHTDKQTNGQTERRTENRTGEQRLHEVSSKLVTSITSVQSGTCLVFF